MKKLLLLVPIMALLAAACNSSQQAAVQAPPVSPNSSTPNNPTASLSSNEQLTADLNLLMEKPDSNFPQGSRVKAVIESKGSIKLDFNQQSFSSGQTTFANAFQKALIPTLNRLFASGPGTGVSYNIYKEGVSQSSIRVELD